ncbi:MAG: hypothetical protein ACFCU9_03510, partial [Cyanophyceae cyanobacterium]
APVSLLRKSAFTGCKAPPSQVYECIAILFYLTAAKAAESLFHPALKRRGYQAPEHLRVG